MRRIEGYVFLVDCWGSEMMFGRKGCPADSDLDLSSNFLTLTSSLVPFAKAMEARLARSEFVQKRMQGNDEYDATSIARIEMLIAEKDEELYLFRKKRSLVVVGYCENGDVCLRGRCLEGCVDSAIPRADLTENEFTTFQRFSDAEYVASELKRQGGGMLTTIATFKLKRL